MGDNINKNTSPGNVKKGRNDYKIIHRLHDILKPCSKKV